MIKDAIESAPKVVDDVVARAPYFAAGATGFFVWIQNNVGVFASIVIGLLTLFGNMYYKRCQLRISEQRNEILRQAMNSRGSVEKVQAELMKDPDIQE